MSQKHKKQHTIYSWVLLFFMIVGVIAATHLVYKRIQMEKEQNHIENIVNYEAILRSAQFSKKSKAEIFQDLKDAGVTSMAIYDMTLKKLAANGDVLVMRGGQTGDIQFYDYDRKSEIGKTYVFRAPNKDAYFDETLEAIKHRLGKESYRVRQTNLGMAIELDPNYDSLIGLNLALSRQQAQDVINEGFNVILRPTNFTNEQRDDIKFELDRMEGLPNITGIVFVGKEALGYKDDLAYTVKRLKSMHIPIIGIEATTQLQYEPQAGFYEMAKMENYEVGRLYTIPDDYLKKLAPSRVPQMYFISDIERNVRYNLFNLYQRGYDNKTALETSINCIKEVSAKLEARGYVLDRASIYPKYKPSFLAMWAVLMGSIALFAHTVNKLIAMNVYKRVLTFTSLTFISVLGYFLYNAVLIRQIWALSAAICAPVTAMIFIMECWQKEQGNTNNTTSKVVMKSIAYVIIAAIISSMGALYIGSILGSNDFFMEFNIFRGVKLTFVMPIILTLIAYLERFEIWKKGPVNSLAKAKEFTVDILKTKVEIATLLMMGGLLIVAWIFVGRSGHSAGVPVPGFELKLRHFLENIMYARPREKEFLIGYPALIVSTYAYLKGWPKKIHLLFTTASVIGVGSMVETFAHIRTPIFMSIMRGIDGCNLGIIVGLIGLCGLLILKAFFQKFIIGEEA